MDMNKCMERISGWFLSDTIELFDLVLFDDEEDPQYSAITTMNRFWVYIQYQKNLNKDYACDSVASLIRQCGYPAEELERFRKKVLEERPVYHGPILDDEFF